MGGRGSKSSRAGGSGTAAPSGDRTAGISATQSAADAAATENRDLAADADDMMAEAADRGRVSQNALDEVKDHENKALTNHNRAQQALQNSAIDQTSGRGKALSPSETAAYNKVDAAVTRSYRSYQKITRIRRMMETSDIAGMRAASGS